MLFFRFVGAVKKLTVGMFGRELPPVKGLFICLDTGTDCVCLFGLRDMVSVWGYSYSVMADAIYGLYADGSNAAIPINLIVIVAKDGLDGIDVEDVLKRLR